MAVPVGTPRAPGNGLVADDDVPSVDDGGDPGEAEQDDVEEEMTAAAALHEDGDGWEKDGDDAEGEFALCTVGISRCR